MADNNTPLGISYGATFLTVVLGKITQMTSDNVAAFTTIFAGAVTGIYTACKIYDWWYKFKRRRAYDRVHKPKTPNNEKAKP